MAPSILPQVYQCPRRQLGSSHLSGCWRSCCGQLLLQLTSWGQYNDQTCWVFSKRSFTTSCVRRTSLFPHVSRFGDPDPHQNLFQFLGPQKVHHFLYFKLREGIKTPSHGKNPLGERGGTPPFPLTFFRSILGNKPSVKGGRGYPPFPLTFLH